LLSSILLNKTEKKAYHGLTGKDYTQQYSRGIIIFILHNDTENN